MLWLKVTNHNCGVALPCEQRVSADDGSGMSSISGSDSESDNGPEEQSAGTEEVRVTQRSPLIRYRNEDGQQYTLWRGLMSPMGDVAQEAPRIWLIIMNAGGHFAAAVSGSCSLAP